MNVTNDSVDVFFDFTAKSASKNSAMSGIIQPIDLETVMNTSCRYSKNILLCVRLYTLVQYLSKKT
jgi:hypothetical protein